MSNELLVAYLIFGMSLLAFTYYNLLKTHNRIKAMTRRMEEIETTASSIFKDKKEK